MQRTVHFTKFTYAEFTQDANGNLIPTFKTVTVSETKPKVALKKAFKTVGFPFNPVKTESGTTLYILDDEIFFKYAHEATPEEALESEDEEED